MIKITYPSDKIMLVNGERFHSKPWVKDNISRVADDAVQFDVDCYKSGMKSIEITNSRGVDRITLERLMRACWVTIRKRGGFQASRDHKFTGQALENIREGQRKRWERKVKS